MGIDAHIGDREHRPAIHQIGVAVELAIDIAPAIIGEMPAINAGDAAGGDGDLPAVIAGDDALPDIETRHVQPAAA